MILILKNPISNYYWLSIADKEFPFLGIIEHTNLLPKEKYNNNNIVYITNYVEEHNDQRRTHILQILSLIHI